jgi:hypothetical protein
VRLRRFGVRGAQVAVQTQDEPALVLMRRLSGPNPIRGSSVLLQSRCNVPCVVVLYAGAAPVTPILSTQLSLPDCQHQSMYGYLECKAALTQIWLPMQWSMARVVTCWAGHAVIR